MATVEFGKARSLAAIPMMSHGRLIGVFSVYRTRVHPFNDRALEQAQAFADQAAVAIENTRQISALEAQLEQAAATREILEVISSASDDEGLVFDAILRNAANLCGAPTARLELADAVRENHYCAASWGEEMRSFKIGEIMPLSQPNDLPTAIREGIVRHIHDLSQSDLYRSGNSTRVRMVEEEGYRTYLCVPLIAKGVSIGAIVLSRREVAPFSDENIALLETFAAQAVIAIENARQFRALRARTSEVQLLNASLEARVDSQVGEIERMGRLKRFLPSAVADTVVSLGSEEMLKSHRALLGVLFCDIRGFTAFCETAEPEETIEVLQTYHEEMGKLINEHGAGVDLVVCDFHPIGSNFVRDRHRAQIEASGFRF